MGATFSNAVLVLQRSLIHAHLVVTDYSWIELKHSNYEKMTFKDKKIDVAKQAVSKDLHNNLKKLLWVELAVGKSFVNARVR